MRLGTPFETAQERYEQYWEKQTEEYSVYYSVQWCEISETLE